MAQVLSNNTTTALPVEKRSLVPSKWENTVREISLAECPQVGLSLAHAFATDSLSLYLLDGDDADSYSDEYKWQLHVHIMTYLAAAHCYSGLVTTIGSDFDTVALWCPPGMYMDGWWTIFRSGMWKLYFQLSTEGRKRYYDEVLPMLHHTMDEVMGKREFYYLAYIGTKPNARGKGYAKKLILDMAAKADAENHPIYLESSSTDNLSYYKRFGFEFRKEITFNRGPAPVPLYIMVREPQGQKKKTDSVTSVAQVETVKA